MASSSQGPHRNQQPFTRSHTHLQTIQGFQITSHSSFWTVGGGWRTRRRTHTDTRRTHELHTERWKQGWDLNLQPSAASPVLIFFFNCNQKMFCDEEDCGVLAGWSLTWAAPFVISQQDNFQTAFFLIKKKNPPKRRVSKIIKTHHLSRLLRVRRRARGAALLIERLVQGSDPFSFNLHCSNRCANSLHHWLTFLNLNQHQEKQAERAGINADISRVKFERRVVKKYYCSQFNRGALARRN